MSRWMLVLVLLSFGPLPAVEPCAPIEGVESILKPGTVLLLGEVHGTAESPAFALDVACHAAHAGHPVVVGFEILPSEQARFDAFLDSDGSPEDRTRMLAGNWWQRSYQDGRGSRAMFELADGLRRLRLEKYTVRAVLFDALPSRGGQQRERDMAATLARTITDSPDAVTIVLAGNRHSRIVPGVPRNVDFEPMGYLLGRQTSFDNIVALNAAHGNGSAWICAPNCGIIEIGGRHGDRRWAIEIDEATRPAGHHGWYHVGGVTASTPAARADWNTSPNAGAVATPAVEGASGKAEARDPAPEVTTETVTGTGATPEPETDGPLSELEQKVQGSWQAYDFVSDSKTNRLRFDGRRFEAQGGPGEWYRGRIGIRDDSSPARIDFEIEDCRCSFKGETSAGIFRWDGDSLVVSAPRPGVTRPQRFVESSGRMMRLRRSAAGSTKTVASP